MNKNDTTITICPICKTSNSQVHLLKIGDNDIYTCNYCGLGTTIGEEFDNNVIDNGQSSESKIELIIRKLILIYEFGFLAKTAKSKIFEVGSGNGDLARYLTSLGHDVTWSDPNINYIKTIKYRFGVDAIQFDLVNENKAITDKYDFVILRHVLEHADNPIKAINNIKTLLKPKGQVVILLPNLNSWARFVSGINWTWNLPEHRFHFTDESLKLLLEKNGFNLVKTKSVFSPFGLPLRLGSKIKPDFLNKILLPISFSLGFLLEFLAIPFKGTNNIMVIGTLE